MVLEVKLMKVVVCGPGAYLVNFSVATVKFKVKFKVKFRVR
jgi:hypothetical protein